MKKSWSIKDIPSLKGKIVLVTGGNSGLGYESVKVFASKYAKVIMASRSLERGNDAKKAIMKDIPYASIDVMSLDLGNLESIYQFANSFKKKYEKLDILLNNAGIMNVPYGKTKDGFEKQIGINHLGHFALTGLLFDLLKRTQESRIVNISSLLHKSGRIDFNSFLYNKNNEYSPQEAYSQSKLANLLFTFELDRRIKSEGLNMSVLAAHPGGAKTNLGRHQTDKKSNNIIKKLIYAMFIQTAEQGALPGIRSSVDSSLQGGMYIGPTGLMESKGTPGLVKPSKASMDVEVAKKLWDISETLTSVSFT